MKAGIALGSAGAIFLAVAFAFGREREYAIEETLSPRIEGRWKLAWFGENPDGVLDRRRDLSEIELHVDEWLDPQVAHSDARWGEGSYLLRARGRVRVADKEAPMFLGVARDELHLSAPMILIDAPVTAGPVLADPNGPLAGCGWGDRFAAYLRVRPEADSESDRLLVAFGSDERGALRPHEYARASNSD